MNTSTRRFILATIAAVVAAAGIVGAQQGGTLTAQQKQQRIDTEAELQSLAVVERKVMMPMPDGVRLATDIYRPKNSSPNSKVPIVFVRTPYNFNFWDV